MNSLFLEHSVWETLRNTQSPIVLYGMGDGADKIIKICNELNIQISGIFASDGFIRNHEFRGFQVERFSDIEKRLGHMIILLAFGTTNSEVIEFIDSVSENHEVYIPDLPVAGDAYFTQQFLEDNLDKFEDAYNLMADEKSKELFGQLIKYKISGKKDYLTNVISREDMFEELFQFGDNETFVDAGAYKGDTIEEFVGLVHGEYNKIFAIEPDGKNYKRLKKNTEFVTKLTTIEAAAWDKDEMLYFTQKSNRGGRIDEGEPNTRGVAIDEFVGNEAVSYIKYDVEGAELKALKGSEKTIKTYKPKLLISAYHRPQDLFELVMFVNEIQPNYKLYLRRNAGYPAWDINLICI